MLYLQQMKESYYQAFPSVLRKALEDGKVSFDGVESDLEMEFEEFQAYRVLKRTFETDSFEVLESDFDSQAEMKEKGTLPAVQLRDFDESDIGNYSCSFSSEPKSLSNVMRLRTKPERRLAIGKLKQQFGILKKKNESNGHIHLWRYEAVSMQSSFQVLTKDEQANFYN